MNALIVAGGDVNLSLLKKLLLSTDYVIALDRGFDYLREIEVLPNILLGDMDSIQSEVPQEVTVQVFPAQKGFTDLEAGLIYAQSLHYRFLTVIGFNGTRLDHFLSSVWLLSQTDGDVHFLDTHNRIRVLKEKITLEKGEYSYFSVIPLSPSVISIDGAKYELDRKEMIPESSLGLSNEWEESVVQVILHSGKALLVESKD